MPLIIVYVPFTFLRRFIAAKFCYLKRHLKLKYEIVDKGNLLCIRGLTKRCQAFNARPPIYYHNFVLSTFQSIYTVVVQTAATP